MKAGMLLVLMLGLFLAARGDREEEEALVVPRRLPLQNRLLPPDSRLYSLDAFGERLRLELRPDSSFLAPDLTLQYVGKEGGGEEPEQPFPSSALAGCFYSGTVEGEAASGVVALSLCGGLRGAFYLQGAEYLIQPANASRGGGGEEGELPLHVLRRSSSSSSNSPPSSPPGRWAKCAVSEDEEEGREGEAQEEQKPHSSPEKRGRRCPDGDSR